MRLRWAYQTAWTYFGSIGRAAGLGAVGSCPSTWPHAGAVAGWDGAQDDPHRAARIASPIADFIASRYGKSRALAALVTLIALVGILPYGRCR